MKNFAGFFSLAIAAKASDIHLVGGEKPMIRIDGELREIDEKSLPNADLEAAIFGILTAEQKKRWKKELDIDFGYEVEDVRFRVNLHQQEGKIGLAARLIPKDIPTPDDLRFEPRLRDMADLLDGLVLVVGPTGHGKSTTIASLIEEINKTRRAHIVTIEDPIEFLFTDKKCLIEQREIGIDTKSFASALKHVLRQDPNVILVGEMRDPETIATVLTAAETGHLVFSTLHTSSAAEAVERIVDVFDGAKQRQVLIQLGAVLRGIVSQQLLPSVDGKRVAAREILINNSAVANLIKENNISQLPSVMQTGAKEGMITMDKSIQALVEAGLVDRDVAARRMGKQKKV
ncbi:MAG: type IV pilus twitching motility protein PilT [Candidatus Magasanikbacteria bacterium]|nr:type IV pilus twitching motility protein PilT [Candidatus Magasanikbacteria bacterium]